MPFPCHAVPLRVENVSFPFDLHNAAVSDSHLPCHAHAMLRLCCGLEKNGVVGAWHGHGMASVNQTRPHCVNQMGKTHSKPLAARHGRGTAWARHGNGLLCVNRPLVIQLDLYFVTNHSSQKFYLLRTPSIIRWKWMGFWSVGWGNRCFGGFWICCVYLDFTQTLHSEVGRVSALTTTASFHIHCHLLFTNYFTILGYLCAELQTSSFLWKLNFCY